MARYSLTFSGFTTSTSLKTLFTLHADGAGEWFELQEVHLSGAGSVASADIMHRVIVQRLDTTTAGTATAQTPGKFDPSSADSKLIAMVNYTAEPGNYLLKELLIGSFNQRGRWQWQQLKGSGIYVQNGIGGAKLGIRIVSSAAGAVDGTIVWEEA